RPRQADRARVAKGADPQPHRAAGERGHRRRRRTLGTRVGAALREARRTGRRDGVPVLRRPRQRAARLRRRRRGDTALAHAAETGQPRGRLPQAHRPRPARLTRGVFERLRTAVACRSSGGDGVRKVVMLGRARRAVRGEPSCNAYEHRRPSRQRRQPSAPGRTARAFARAHRSCAIVPNATHMNAYALPRFSLRFVPVFRRNLLVWRKLAFASIIGNVADPLIILVAFGYGLGSLLERVEGVPYIVYLAAGSMCMSTMMAASFESLYSAFSRMHVQRTWESLMNAPLELDDIVIAEWAWAGAKAVLSGFAILVVVWVLDISRAPTLPLTLFVVVLTG